MSQVVVSCSPASTSFTPVEVEAPTVPQFGKSFRSAFERTAAVRDALPLDQCVTINMDVPSMVAAVTTVVPSIRALRDRMAKLAEFDVANVDDLEAYADALSYAHTAYLGASVPKPELPETLDRATTLRDRLLGDAQALAGRGVIESAWLNDLRGGTGYLAVAYDLGALAQQLRKRWSTIAGGTMVRLDELDEADALQERLARGFAERNRHSPVLQEAQDTRARAYTLLFRAYEQVRRAVGYLRFNEGDAQKIAPSLFTGRGGRGRIAPSDDEEPVETQPGLGPMPMAPPPAAPGLPGLPGGSPFA